MTNGARTAWRRRSALACAVLSAACTAGAQRPTAAVAPGTGYVALGSSFAAGPGIVPGADQPPTRCARSAGNYAHLLAGKLGLRLRDVTCSGATTAHLLGPWNDLPPQLDAVTGDTRLVTVTIGGNDVGYIGGLGSASCRRLPSPPPGAPGGACPEPPRVSEAAWTDLDTALRRIVAEVRRRAPAARLVFVDYLTVLPASGGCPAVPLSPAEADAGRATAARLAALTAKVARQTGAEVLQASALSRDHGACGRVPWVTGFPLPGSAGFVPYHPNRDGMAVVADALARRMRGP